MSGEIVFLPGVPIAAAPDDILKNQHYRNDARVMNELAAHVGNIDRTSARILYDSGKDLG